MNIHEQMSSELEFYTTLKCNTEQGIKVKVERIQVTTGALYRCKQPKQVGSKPPTAIVREEVPAVKTKTIETHM